VQVKCARPRVHVGRHAANRSLAALGNMDLRQKGFGRGINGTVVMALKCFVY